MGFDHLVALREISKGNEDAFSCLNTIFTWWHALDDLVDNDKPVPLAATIGAFLQFIEVISSNKFFQANKTTLMPLIRSGALAYLASEKFRKSESPLLRIGSQILKSQYVDLFFEVAFIVGGIDHAIAMSDKYREYDFDPVPAP